MSNQSLNMLACGQADNTNEGRSNAKSYWFDQLWVYTVELEDWIFLSVTAGRTTAAEIN